MTFGEEGANRVGSALLAGPHRSSSSTSETPPFVPASSLARASGARPASSFASSSGVFDFGAFFRDGKKMLRKPRILSHSR